jgi:E3 ubiquitin-protein ligase BRE1
LSTVQFIYFDGYEFLLYNLYSHVLLSCGRQLMESRDREVAELAGVHVLRYSLNESKLEQRVIAANEAEAISQQRLATAEAEVAELGQKLETSRRYSCIYSLFLLPFRI